MERLRLFAGLGLIALILGSGVLMSLFLLQESDASISQTDWQTTKQTIAELVQRSNTTSQPFAQTAAKAPTTAVLPPSGPVAINQASEQELDSLPGIGAVRAKAIVDARASGPFVDLDDLHARVPKLPRSVLDEISEKITF